MGKSSKCGKRRLTTKQLGVLNDLFFAGFDEEAALEKHGIRRRTYDRWFFDEFFWGEFCRRIERLVYQSRLIVARYSAHAAAKLVELTESAKEETARKACVDIIKLLPHRPRKGPQAEEKGESQVPDQLSEDAAGRLLAVLAEEKKSGRCA